MNKTEADTIFSETFLKFLPRKINFLGEYETLGVLFSTSRCLFGHLHFRDFGEVLLFLWVKSLLISWSMSYETNSITRFYEKRRA